MTEEPETSGRGRRSKVARLIEEYNLEGIGEEMERLWTDEQDRRSLRDLAKYFNHAIIEVVLENAGVQLLDGEIENIYRLLTDEEVGNADRTRARRRLEREGIDVDGLSDDFVTYQAIRSYLQGHRGAEYTPDRRDPIERELTNVRQLQGRIDSVTEGKLQQLRESDDVELGDFRTIVTIQVYCEDCNSQLAVEELLEQGGCDCT